MNLNFVCTCIFSDKIFKFYGNLRGKYPIILRMREQSVAGLLLPQKRPVKEANAIHTQTQTQTAS